MKLIIKSEFNEHLKISNNTMDSISADLEIAAKLCVSCLKNGGKI